MEKTFEQVKDEYLKSLSTYLTTAADEGAESEAARKQYREYIAAKDRYIKKRDKC